MSQHGGTLARQVELSPIQQLLPDEMLALVLSHLPSVYALGAVACVCRGWRDAAQNPALWRAACARTFPELQHDALARLARANHRCGARRGGTRCYSRRATLVLLKVWKGRQAKCCPGGTLCLLPCLLTPAPVL